jgi:F-type H+-transporting ATPase subunit gamma
MSLSDLKRRIGTVKNTSKITKAMSLISAAQISKFKNLLQSYENYHRLICQFACVITLKARTRLDTSIENVPVDDKLVVESCQKYLGIEVDYIVGKRKLLVIITGEKGLCGSFNSSVVSKTLSMVDDDTDVLCVGKKGFEMLMKNRKKKISIVDSSYIDLNSKQISAKIVMEGVTEKLLRLLASNLYIQLEVVYTEFKTMLRQEVVTKKLFPLILDNCNFEEIAFDSNPMVMLDHVIPQYINSVMYFATLNSIKSETVKRMMTMDSANKNSKDMLHDLTLKYNRARQTKVTMELIEVISGMV